MAYEPLNPPDVTDFADWWKLKDYLIQELRNVAVELNRVRLIEYHAVPDKPFHLQRVLADGTDWNPGSGRGIYWFDEDSGTWKFLG